jgi:hypothetical protein
VSRYGHYLAYDTTATNLFQPDRNNTREGWVMVPH